jgi:hypothetical protein
MSAGARCIGLQHRRGSMHWMEQVLISGHEGLETTRLFARKEDKDDETW